MLKMDKNLKPDTDFYPGSNLQNVVNYNYCNTSCKESIVPSARFDLYALRALACLLYGSHLTLVLR